MKCPTCGKEYPSDLYLKTPSMCNQCYEELPEEEKEKIEKTIAVQEKLDEKIKAQDRKKFYIGLVVGAALAIGLNFIISPFQLFIAPFVAGIITQKAGRGAGVGFMTLFIYGIFLAIIGATIVGSSSVLPLSTGEIVGSGIVGSIILGVGFGIWPGAVLGLIGGFIGSIFKK